MRKVNAEKSKKKIKELTEKHQLAKQKAAQLEEDSDSGEEVKEQKPKSEGKPKGEGKGEKEEKKYANKGTISDSKMKNKRK